jgi:hypothetical protein
MDEHVKAWIAEKVARELNPPPKPKPRFEGTMNLRWGLDFAVIRPDSSVLLTNCT